MNEEHDWPAAENASAVGQPGGRQLAAPDLVDHLRQYAREKPEVVALWCLGIGFVLGWKLKIW
jgi:hypothetical protein